MGVPIKKYKIVTLQMLKNENKRDNLFILTNVINVSEQHFSRDFNHRYIGIYWIYWVMLMPAVM